MQIDPRRPARQDTFDIRDQILHGDLHGHAPDSATYASTDEEEHSILEDDSGDEDRDEYMDEDDDASSDLSIPNESIDFDLVYAFHSFAATVEGQANVVKGDSLFLMDDSNSYWWLVRVLKTQEVGYIPAENIETPFERLARLNKHRNVDLASATQSELQDNLHASQDRLRNNLNSRTGNSKSPSPTPQNTSRSRFRKNVNFAAASSFSVHRYPPAVWNEDEEEDPDTEWDLDPYDEEESTADERVDGPAGMEPDDGMHWEDSAAKDNQVRQVAAPQGAAAAAVPASLRPGHSGGDLQQQQMLQQQQLQAQQQQQMQREQLLAQQQQQLDQQRRASGNGSRDGHEDYSAAPRKLDPAEATETRKMTVTPTIARESIDEPRPGQPLGPSALVQRQQEDERQKRLREEDAEEARKRAKGKQPEKTAMANTSGSTLQKTNSKLRKERSVDSSQAVSSDDDPTKKKKSSGVFGGLFGRKSKDKKDKGSIDEGRNSEDYGRRQMDGVLSPTTATAMQQQQQQQDIRTSVDPRRSTSLQGHNPSGSQSEPSTPPQVSHHASHVRQWDQQHQALYQQYLNRSPSSPPEGPNYGLQSASAVLQNSYNNANPPANNGLAPPAARPRPGSLILSPTTMEGAGVGLPDLSVIRVFAGKNLQTEATFKTVLLNANITSEELVKQAIQRFRLPTAEDEREYYLTIKHVGGSSSLLANNEKPLAVFEGLVEAAMEPPKVKRSSVGSISSVASNLSMHPAIKQLAMNDFSDDSVVKFYLNRRNEDGSMNDSLGHEGDGTLIAADTSMTSDGTGENSQLLTVGPNIGAERFSSPSFRFALQLVIYPDDLPDDMVFDPLTEAIVFKHTLRDRPNQSAPSSGVTHHLRRKVFVFPKNVTVAEVIELGLERFGIQEGVVDGGDEVEDKLSKRMSMARVRYGLAVSAKGQERELPPSSRVIDAFPRPPTYRTVDKKYQDSKRRSIDSAQLLGTPEDVNPDDPIFILRRAVSYKVSRHNRMSAALDDVAMAKLRMNRESASSLGSDGPAAGDDPAAKLKQQKELIAAQRAARRDNQRAILSAQANSVRGVDVVLPGNAVLRSSRYDANDRMRYSYVEPDGETYDISDLVEEEWQEINAGQGKEDLLESVLGRNKDDVGQKLDRVLSKLRNGKQQAGSAAKPVTSRSSSPGSDYSADGTVEGGANRAGSVTPSGTRGIPAVAARSITPLTATNRSSPAPDTSRAASAASSRPSANKRNPSVASIISDMSGYETAPTGRSPTPLGRIATPTNKNKMNLAKHRQLIEDDFGVAGMLAIIEYKGSKPKVPLAPMDPVDRMLFGRPIKDVEESLHPKVREIYKDSFRQLEDMDRVLDEFLRTRR